MSHPVDTLHVAAWTFGSTKPKSLSLTRFQLSGMAYQTITQWTREKTGKPEPYMKPILRGLSEIMAWFVPGVAYTDTASDDEGGSSRVCLSLYFLGDIPPHDRPRRGIQTALNVWLNIIYPDKPAEMRDAIARAAQDDDNWRAIEISTSLAVRKGTCPVPEDKRLFNALTAQAVAILAGQTIRFRSGESRVIVAETPNSSIFGGVELVTFPPQRTPDGNGFWSEVLTICTATFPERDEIHLLARPSIRNWGAIRYAGGSNAPSRSLDLFIPPDERRQGFDGYRHASLTFQATYDDSSQMTSAMQHKPIVCTWKYDDSQRVFDLLRRLSSPGSINKDVLTPVIDNDGLWALPRLGSIFGDRFLAGGSGIPWPDRQDIAESVDSVFGKIGLERVEQMNRIGGQMPIDRPFKRDSKKAEQSWPIRRDAVLQTLAALGNKNRTLEIMVFHQLEETPNNVIRHLEELLGTPDVKDGQLLRWNDGLTISVRTHPSGVLAEQLPKAELSDDERSRFNRKQQAEVWKAKQADAFDSVKEQMRKHIESARAGSTAVACAIVEMPSSLRDQPRRDPYAMTRAMLAHARILPQVVLVDKKQSFEKYRAALRDCLRMLGVVPLEAESIEFAPTALTIIQRNDDVVGGGRIDGHAFPLAARVKGGILECALPTESGEPEWLPYGKAALRIFSGDYGKFGRGRQDENVGKFRTFFANVLDHIDRSGPSLVIAEEATISHKLETFRNGTLLFDVLQIGGEMIRPENLPNVRILRLAQDSLRQPHYYHDTDTKWTSGIFGWGNARRTFYALKPKPQTVSHESSFASQKSRHATESDGRSSTDVPRPLAQLDEFCAVFMQAGDEPQRLVRLADRLRTTHAQYDDGTNLPFPLHELRLLGKGITQ